MKRFLSVLVCAALLLCVCGSALAEPIELKDLLGNLIFYGHLEIGGLQQTAPGNYTNGKGVSLVDETDYGNGIVLIELKGSASSNFCLYGASVGMRISDVEDQWRMDPALTRVTVESDYLYFQDNWMDRGVWAYASGGIITAVGGTVYNADDED